MRIYSCETHSYSVPKSHRIRGTVYADMRRKITVNARHEPVNIAVSEEDTRLAVNSAKQLFVGRIVLCKSHFGLFNTQKALGKSGEESRVKDGKTSWNKMTHICLNKPKYFL